MGTDQASTPLRCRHVFVLGEQAEIRHLIPSVVCWGVTGIADEVPFALEAFLWAGEVKQKC